jgi:hypothetical protein
VVFNLQNRQKEAQDMNLFQTTALLAVAAAAAQDIYEQEVGIANNRKFWYPEWRMKELVDDAVGTQSIGERKLDVEREQEFYLTEDEIEEVLSSMNGLSLERRIEKVLDMRSYDDYDFDEYDGEEEMDKPEEKTNTSQLQKGQQRKLPSRHNIFNKDRRGKRDTNKRGGRNNKLGGGQNKKRGKRGKKRNKRGKRPNNKHQTFKYQNKQYKNNCLDPPDR